MLNEKNKIFLESKVYLPKLETKVATIFEYLVVRFPHLSKDVLAKRIEEGKIFFSDKTPILLTTPYKYGVTLFYYRENPEEIKINFQEKIIFQNNEILVVDKPHFIPVTPSGKYVNECLLSRVIKKCQIKDLTPVHRLDKDTAGIIIFSKNKNTRSLYHKLFQNREISRKYYAVCEINTLVEQKEWLVENRLTSSDPWYKMKIENGQVNAITYIKLLDIKDRKGLFFLEPRTGKKHQLRLHLSTLGFNIVNDPLYPEIVDKKDSYPPMQLLAYSLSFYDPVSMKFFEFFSEQTLDWPAL